MNTAEHTTVAPPAQLASEQAARASARRRARVTGRVRLEHLALTAVLALSAVLNVNRLAQNEFGNTFYSSAVHSMLRSWHNFFFVSFDPGGLITVDKPPLGLWVQGLSAELFGFHPLSLLLPEAIMGVLSVAALYWIIRPRWGAAAGIASALALAVYPSFVAISRENGVDSVLILLMILACGLGLRACETGRLRTLLGCAALVGLAFNAKTLAAYLVVPGLALGYLVCAPPSLPRRAGQLLAAGAALLAVSASWSAIVELTPASQRPFVGGSTDNTELNLTFGYNGFGRVEGQVGGPGRIPVLARFGSLAHLEHEALRARALRAAAARGPRPGGPAPLTSATRGAAPRHAAHHSPQLTHHVAKPAYLPNGHAREPTAFGGRTGPLRLLKVELGGQAGWMLPFAVFGLIALALWSIGPRSEQCGGRRDRRLAGLIVLGGWFAVEGLVLSFGKGIVHPYYVSALGPGAAAMVGGGAVALLAPGARRRARLALIPLAVASTVAVQLKLLADDHYMRWFWPVLIAGSVLGVVVLVAGSFLDGGPRRRSQLSSAAPARAPSRTPAIQRTAMGLLLCLLLIAPGAYATTTWEVPVEGTFPAAGPRAAGSPGPLGIDPRGLFVTKRLIAYVNAHHPGTRWDVLTEASDTAAPAVLLGDDAGAMGGYSGNDPALDGQSLARLVQRGEARYVVLGGAYASRGGNAATTAVIRACRVIPASAWQPPPVDPNALLLYDCAGRERALRASAH